MSLINLKNIKKSYFIGQIETKILHGIDLKIEKGEFVAIMGPSGSGKSTLMNILGFLDTPSSGEYFYNDTLMTDLNEQKLAEIRNKEIGFVFQSFYLLQRMTAKENVALPMIYAYKNQQEQDERAIEALKIVGLADRINHRPNELSGGQQQRVAIARALSNKPKIIFADEPTGNLDSKSSDEILNIFKKLHKQGNTLIMVTHSRQIAENASRIITIKDGNILSDEQS